MTTTPTLTQSIGQAENALRAILEQMLAATGITFVQWITFNMLARGQSSVQQKQLIQQIADALKLDDQTILTALGELNSRGLITISSDDPVAVGFTATGEALFHALRQRVGSVTERIFGGLPAEDLATTRRVLGLVAERASRELGR